MLDGEIAVADSEGHTDFGALQDALSQNSDGFSFYIFDLLQLNGEDLRRRPQRERKKKLKALLASVKGPLSYSDHIEGEGGQVFARACDLKLEGVISKRADDPYISGRTHSWLKSKCGQEQEFVVIGWRPADRAGRPFRSILLAVREKGALRYAGRVGSGYTGARLETLSAAFKKHARKSAPVNDIPPAIARQARFLDPVLVAEIAFRGWTRDNLIRQGSFKGLRGDKSAREIVREKAMPKAAAARTSNDSDEIEGVRVTHPDRVLFPGDGVTKRDIAEYYLKVADLMLPHIIDRPLALVRCPRGSEQKCFFQKHASPGWPDLFKKVRIKEKSGTDDYLYIEDAVGLVAAAQMDILELHIWGAHVDKIEKPDRLVFDFDPGDGIAFERVKEAARELRERLQKLGLESFPMATGGKGIHVVVPLSRGHSWDQHRAFAEAMARLMAEDSPARYVANMSKAKRPGKIYVDFLRNQRGATAIAPYSTRARKGAYVAMPLSWNALSRLEDAHPASVMDAARLARAGDPWKGYAKLKQALPLSKLKIK